MESTPAIFAQLFFYLTLMFVVVYGWMLGYHWYQYGTKRGHATTAISIFAVGAIVLLSVMLIALQYVS